MRGIARLGRLLMRLLRELSDEAAYERHLTLHGKTSSAQEWRHFSEKRLGAKYTRPKCC